MADLTYEESEARIIILLQILAAVFQFVSNIYITFLIAQWILSMQVKSEQNEDFGGKSTKCTKAIEIFAIWNSINFQLPKLFKTDTKIL